MYMFLLTLINLNDGITKLLKAASAQKPAICHESGDCGESSESTNICNSAGPPQDYESSGTSLKLGWAHILAFEIAFLKS